MGQHSATIAEIRHRRGIDSPPSRTRIAPVLGCAIRPMYVKRDTWNQTGTLNRENIRIESGLGDQVHRKAGLIVINRIDGPIPQDGAQQFVAFERRGDVVYHRSGDGLADVKSELDRLRERGNSGPALKLEASSSACDQV